MEGAEKGASFFVSSVFAQGALPPLEGDSGAPWVTALLHRASEGGEPIPVQGSRWLDLSGVCARLLVVSGSDLAAPTAQ